MSWYVSFDGRQVWVDSSERVLTCDKPEEELKIVPLTYLASNTQKTVFAEYSVDDDDGKKGKKKERQSGRQRGFVVRVDNGKEDRVVVLTPFQATLDRLLSSGVASRVDLEESEGKKRNKKGKEVKEEPAEEQPAGVPLGPNECRVELASRCQHQAHGVGFTLSLAEPGHHQRIHMFTAGKELSLAEMHEKILEACRDTEGQIFMGRMSPAIAPDPPESSKDNKNKKDMAKEDEDDWLDSLMGRCMVGGTAKEKRGGSTEAAATGAPADDPGSSSGYTQAEPPAPKKEVQLPPWLRKR
eukprot:TRINITY_DN2891_c0_g1_i2.p1 TRINITY_DN2891_c0_g1~~TRINITY_DN2891_c0_g1_i2.p1  ORF type:complete len:298 (-),score=80.01 TRINITY_DN2891_c0_g1_i2:76-969(-)